MGNRPADIVILEFKKILNHREIFRSLLKTPSEVFLDLGSTFDDQAMPGTKNVGIQPG